MKLPVVLAILAIFGFRTASAQNAPMTPQPRGGQFQSGGRAENRPRPGAIPLSPPRDYPMRAIPIKDPRFQSVYLAVLEMLAKTAGEIPPATIGDFSDRLQMGDSYVIQKGLVTETCVKCNGVGRIPIKDNRLRTGDGKTECSECKGVGKVNRILQLLIKW